MPGTMNGPDPDLVQQAKQKRPGLRVSGAKSLATTSAPVVAFRMTRSATMLVIIVSG
jgi:hypothetical protein